MRFLPRFAVAGLSIAVLGAVVLALWVAGSAANEREPFSTVRLVPAGTDLYIAINTEPATSQWIAFAHVLNSISVEDTLRDAWNDLLADEDIRWDSDIVSLLGDEAFLAITDFGAIEDGSGIVAGFEIRSERKARDLFLRLADDVDEILDVEYQGETIFYTEAGPFDSGFFGLIDEVSSTDPAEVRDNGAIAFVDNVALIGATRGDVQGVIDVMQGRSPSIADDARFVELQAQQTDDFLLWGYVDFSSAWDLVEEILIENGDETFDTDRFMDQLRENADRMTYSVSSRRDGFLIDVSLLRAPGVPADNDYALSTVFESHYAEQVPADTLAFIAGYDLYNQFYVPGFDAIAGLDVNLSDPYCSDLGGITSIGPVSLDPVDDPILRPFVDEFGFIDEDAFFAWVDEVDARFTDEDGRYDFEGYLDYIDELYEQACAETAQTIEEALEELEDDLGFDLENDLLSLMTGEFAVVLNASGFDQDEPDINVLGLLDITGAARVRESMELIGQYLEREEDWLLLDPDEDDISRLIEFRGDGTIAWNVSNDTLSVSFPDGPVEGFVRGLDGESLADSEDWQQLMALLPEEKTFVAYLSLARIIEEIREIEDAENELSDASDGEITFDDLLPIRSLGIATTPVDGGWAIRIAILVTD